jgi:hypothetical protein
MMPTTTAYAHLATSSSSSSSIHSTAASQLMSTSSQAQPLPKYVVFGSSGLGGCLGWVIVHPFNTLAVRSNLASASGQTFSLSSMLKNQGFWSLYDGLSAGVARQVFYATSRLGLFEIFRDVLHEFRGKTDFTARYVVPVVFGNHMSRRGWAGVVILAFFHPLGRSDGTNSMFCSSHLFVFLTPSYCNH